MYLGYNLTEEKLVKSNHDHLFDKVSAPRLFSYIMHLKLLFVFLSVFEGSVRKPKLNWKYEVSKKAYL